jgi:hypothetical protein
VELKNEENIPEDKAYINITINEMSCHSWVGKGGFIQPLEIGGCRDAFMILHEFVHALGIFFFISQYMYYYSDLPNNCAANLPQMLLIEQLGQNYVIKSPP